MAVNIPSSALKQVRKTRELNQNGQGYQIQYKGTSYAALETAAAAFKKGDVVETGWILDSWHIEGVPGGGGILTITCGPDDSGGSGGTQKALKAVWTCKSVRNDVSILAYCGPSGSHPNRVEIELWQKETDAAVANEFKYHPSENSAPVEMNELSKAVAEKIAKGVESVIRFYPVLTCTSTWSRIPGTFIDDLGFIDTPGAPSADETLAPTNLSTIISAYEWLKVQDDVGELPDGKFTRTESWMGIKKTDGQNAWDPDLYGANRWSMPYEG